MSLRATAKIWGARASEHLFKFCKQLKNNFHGPFITPNGARPRSRTQKTAPKKVQQTCNLASMQAQLSELQKMFCKDSEAVNENKQVQQCTGVSFLDSKDFIKSR